MKRNEIIDHLFLRCQPLYKLWDKLLKVAWIDKLSPKIQWIDYSNFFKKNLVQLKEFYSFAVVTFLGKTRKDCNQKEKKKNNIQQRENLA